QQEASVLPSGLKATPVSRSPWPFKSVRGLLVVRSHNLMALSSQAVASVLPSGLKATPKMAVTAPSKAVCRGSQAGGSHRFAVWSQLPVRKVLPSGDTASEVTQPAWAG